MEGLSRKAFHERYGFCAEKGWVCESATFNHRTLDHLSTMRNRIFITAVLGLGVLFLSGCSPYGYGSVMRFPDEWNRRAGGHGNRIDNDVRDYVRFVDRYVRLSNQQASRIDRMLTDRTYQLLERNRNPERVYPFPRRYVRDQNNTERRFWRSADATIERYLDRRQRREYRDLVREEFNSRDRYDRRDNNRNRRYDRD